MTQRAQAIAELHREERLAILQQTANGRHNPPEAIAALDAIRWIERTVQHVWRMCHYLVDAERGIAAEDGELPAPFDE